MSLIIFSSLRTFFPNATHVVEHNYTDVGKEAICNESSTNNRLNPENMLTTLEAAVLTANFY
jgi:hypothetical protein